MLASILRVLTPGTFAFLIGFSATPIVSHYLYTFRVWKKVGGKRALDGNTASEFNRLHGDGETKTPRMGGIIVWGSVVITTLGIALIGHYFPGSRGSYIDFLTRKETWIPLSTLIVGSIVGFFNDVLDISRGGKGLALRYRLLIVLALSSYIGWWFYVKLAVTAIDIPFSTPLYVGWLIVPFFIFVSLSLYASGVIDGIDGLSGGVFASIFSAYAIIAFAQHQSDISAFCLTMVGGLLAFLWFNVPPARFYMSETGTMGITLTIASVAFMTDSIGNGFGISVLPIIGGILVVTVLSNIIQIAWKKAFHRKFFRIAPLHHHFEAIGWPGSKVVMRYWILSIVLAAGGVFLALCAISLM